MRPAESHSVLILNPLKVILPWVSKPVLSHSTSRRSDDRIGLCLERHDCVTLGECEVCRDRVNLHGSPLKLCFSELKMETSLTDMGLLMGDRPEQAHHNA